MRSILFVGAMLLTGGSAQAQFVEGFTSIQQPGLAFGQYGAPFPLSGRAYNAYIPTQFGFDFGNGVQVFDSNVQPISLDQFASSQQVRDIQARQEQFAFFMQRDFDRLSQGIALASALTIMPPNPGDRFAVTVGGAGFDGRGAGAISGTYRVREDILVFGGYARSETQNLVKGGATFSFR